MTSSRLLVDVLLIARCADCGLMLRSSQAADSQGSCQGVLLIKQHAQSFVPLHELRDAVGRLAHPAKRDDLLTSLNGALCDVSEPCWHCTQARANEATHRASLVPVPAVALPELSPATTAEPSPPDLCPMCTHPPHMQRPSLTANRVYECGACGMKWRRDR